MTTPNTSRSRVLPDGTVEVTYGVCGDPASYWSVTYPDSRSASIESLLVLFPGTSRAWLDKHHRPAGMSGLPEADSRRSIRRIGEYGGLIRRTRDLLRGGRNGQ